MVTSSFFLFIKPDLIVILVVEVLHENAAHQTLDPSLYPHLVIICCLFCLLVLSLIYFLNGDYSLTSLFSKYSSQM